MIENRRCTNVQLGLVLFFPMIAIGVLMTSCGHSTKAVEDREVMIRGSVEVTAHLVEIPGEFPSNDLYDYAYILKYRVLKVHRGAVEGDEIFVAHYNPLKPRYSVQDEFSGEVGGDLKWFRAGGIHRMALEMPMDDYYMGGIVDKYFLQKGVRYWAVWTNLEQE